MIVLRVPKAERVYEVALAADGSRVAVLFLFFDDKNYQGVRVCDPAGGAWWADPGEPMWNPLHLATHPAGRYVAWGNWDGSIIAADLASGERADVADGTADAGKVRRLQFSPDGGELWAVSRRVRRWAVGSWQPLPPAGPDIPTGGHVRVSGDGTAVAAWEEHWGPHSMLTTLSFSSPAGAELVELTFPKKYWNACAIDPPGRLFAAAGATNALNVWAVATGQELFHRPPRRGTHVGAVAFTPDGRTLLVGQGTGVRAFDTETWAEGQAYDWRAGKVTCLAVAAGGLTAAAGTKTGRVVVWDLGG